MPAPVPNHPFVTRSSRGRLIEGAVFWLMRLATYFVLVCGLCVLGYIFLKGGRTVFQAEFPYVNVPFLTQAPETLYVFEHEGQKMQLGDRDFRAFREAATAKAKAAGQPAPQFRTESYVYSAGGIWPCIVGTVLLVVGSMSIALILGVASAIYLNEYAKDTPGVRAIRLAILNLAGVPSIVFGLFGLGFFVQTNVPRQGEKLWDIDWDTIYRKTFFAWDGFTAKETLASFQARQTLFQ